MVGLADTVRQYDATPAIPKREAVGEPSQRVEFVLGHRAVNARLKRSLSGLPLDCAVPPVGADLAETRWAGGSAPTTDAHETRRLAARAFAVFSPPLGPTGPECAGPLRGRTNLAVVPMGILDVVDLPREEPVAGESCDGHAEVVFVA